MKSEENTGQDSPSRNDDDLLENKNKFLLEHRGGDHLDYSSLLSLSSKFLLLFVFSFALSLFPFFAFLLSFFFFIWGSSLPLESGSCKLHITVLSQGGYMGVDHPLDNIRGRREIFEAIYIWEPHYKVILSNWIINGQARCDVGRARRRYMVTATT